MPRDTAPFTFADACEIVAGARPVSLSDPAWFACGPRFNKDRTPREDYGKVFARRDGGEVLYTFDRDGEDFAKRVSNGPLDGYLEFQGRGFQIVVVA